MVTVVYIFNGTKLILEYFDQNRNYELIQFFK